MCVYVYAHMYVRIRMCMPAFGFEFSALEANVPHGVTAHGPARTNSSYKQKNLHQNHQIINTQTTNRAALVNTDGFGLGVVNTNVEQFLGGFSGDKGSGGPHDSPAGYIAPIKAVQLAPTVDFSFTSHIVLGNLKDIRAYAVDVAVKEGRADANVHLEAQADASVVEGGALLSHMLV